MLTYCKWTLRNTLKLNLIQNTKIFIEGNSFENGGCKMAAIFLCFINDVKLCFLDQAPVLKCSEDICHRAPIVGGKLLSPAQRIYLNAQLDLWKNRWLITIEWRHPHTWDNVQDLIIHIYRYNSLTTHAPSTELIYSHDSPIYRNYNSDEKKFSWPDYLYR